MRILRGLDSFEPPAGGCVLAIGNFDGVHRGHQALLRRARQIAEPHGVPVVALTFEPHPLAVLAPQRAPARLTTLDERLALLARAGADVVIVEPATRALLAVEPQVFVERLIERCGPRAIVEGPTFRFGHGRAGDVGLLRALGGRFGFEVHVLDQVRCDSIDDEPPINSSAIRRLLADGRVEDAAAMLGRPHRVVGLVGSGEARGRTLGFPTANLDDIPQMLPAHGVYAAVAQLDDAALYAAAVNVGPQPTFDQTAARVEAHLLDFSGELHGRRVGLWWLRRLRGQQRFDSPEALRRQLERDVEHVRALGDPRAVLGEAPLLPLG